MAEDAPASNPRPAAWIDNIKNELSQETARDIVKDLNTRPLVQRRIRRKLGGAPRPNQHQPQRNDQAPNHQTEREIPNNPGGRDAMPGPAGGVPRPKAANQSSTQSATVTRPNIALDLVPDRFDKNKRNTPQDWYVLYAEGGLLRRRLERYQAVANTQDQRLQRHWRPEENSAYEPQEIREYYEVPVMECAPKRVEYRPENTLLPNGDATSTFAWRLQFGEMTSRKHRLQSLQQQARNLRRQILRPPRRRSWSGPRHGMRYLQIPRIKVIIKQLTSQHDDRPYFFAQIS